MKWISRRASGQKKRKPISARRRKSWSSKKKGWVEIDELARGEEQEAKKKLDEARSGNDAAVQKMEALYKERSTQWVQEIVRRVLEA